jgi:hypothetical protein
MSDDRDHTVASATVTSEDKPYGVRIDGGPCAARRRAGRPGRCRHRAASVRPAALRARCLHRDHAADVGERQGWPLAGVDVKLTYVVKDKNTKWIDRLITLRGIDDEQSAKLAEIAEKTPVTRAVRTGTEIRTTTGIR